MQREITDPIHFSPCSAAMRVASGGGLVSWVLMYDIPKWEGCCQEFVLHGFSLLSRNTHNYIFRGNSSYRQPLCIAFCGRPPRRQRETLIFRFLTDLINKPHPSGSGPFWSWKCILWHMNLPYGCINMP